MSWLTKLLRRKNDGVLTDFSLEATQRVVVIPTGDGVMSIEYEYATGRIIGGTMLAGITNYGLCWIVSNAAEDRWRCWEDGWSTWTDDKEKATRYARREDAEAVHQHDDAAWKIKPYIPEPDSWMLAQSVNDPVYRTPDKTKAEMWDSAESIAKARGYDGLVDAVDHLPTKGNPS